MRVLPGPLELVIRLKSPAVLVAIATCAVAAAALILLPRACERGGERRIPAEEAILERQVRGLETLVGAARRGPIVPFDQILVTVDEKLVRELLESATPYERIVDGKYRIRVDSAAVSFRDGFALVELQGRGSLAGRDEGTVFVDVNVYGGLEVLGLDPASGVLRARVGVIGFEARRAAVLGLKAPVGGLLEDLARAPIEDFNVLGSELEIPVAIEEKLTIPEIGPEGELHIEAATVPLRVAVHDVTVMSGKIWVGVGVEALEQGEGEVRAGVDTTGVPGGGAARGEAAGPAEPESTQRVEPPEPAQSAEPAEPGQSTELADPNRSAEPADSNRSAESAQPDRQARGREAGDTIAGRLAGLRKRSEALQDTVVALTMSDTLLMHAANDTGDVAVGIRTELIERLLQEVSRRYLDRVDLDLQLDEHVEEGEKVKAKVLFATITAGEWKVNVTIHRVRGTLSAGVPQLAVTEANRFRLTMPVHLREGYGNATIRFRWDASGVANVACEDFQTTLDVTGSVIPRDYTVTGDLVLDAEGERVVARPELPVTKVRISVSPSKETWREVRSTLSGLDKFGKCGIGLSVLSPDKVVSLLTNVTQKGFNVKLPTKLVPTLDLPASVSESVEVEGRLIQLAVRPNVLRVTPGVFWYSAAVDAGIQPLRPERETPLPPPAAPGPPEAQSPSATSPGG